MLPCPIPNCGYKNDVNAVTCAKCGEDLSSYSKLYFLPAYYYNQGLKAAENREFDEAIKNLQVSASLDPSDIDTLILLGKAYAIKGDYKSAMEYWQQVLEINPNNIEAEKCMEKVVKILDETPQIPKEPTEPSDLSPILKEISLQLKNLEKVQEKQNEELKEIRGQIQSKEEVNKITLSLAKSQDFQERQNQRLTKMEKWLKIGSIAACMLITLLAILALFLWRNLKDQSQRIADIQKEQVFTTTSIKTLSKQLESISAKSEEFSKQTTKNYLTVQQGLKETSSKAEMLDKQLRNLQNQVKELSNDLSIFQKQISEIKNYQQIPIPEVKRESTK